MRMTRYVLVFFFFRLQPHARQRVVDTYRSPRKDTHTRRVTSVKHIKVTSTPIHDAVGTRCERRRYGVMKTIRTCSPNIEAATKLRNTGPDRNPRVREQRIGLTTVLENFAHQM